MEMHQVRYFLAAVSELNFTKAAEKCNVSQPSLTRAIKQLEGELGGDLFRRERPQAQLTELGERMLPLLRAVARPVHRTATAILLSSSLTFAAKSKLGAAETAHFRGIPDRPSCPQGIERRIAARVVATCLINQWRRSTKVSRRPRSPAYSVRASMRVPRP